MSELAESNDSAGILASVLGAMSAPGECLADAKSELDERIARIPAELNSYGYDPWGYHPDAFSKFLLPGVMMYRYWFRCITQGIENVPEGRCLLIGNHAGQVALDGLMIMTAMVLEAEPPRLTRAMGEYWLGTLPWLNVIIDRIGSSIGTPQTCADMLDRGEVVLAFPEGIRGMNKLYADAYKLQEFGGGFMRLALETKTPIVPVAIVGSEEQAPAIANLESLGRVFNMPAFPITWTWPWLGPLGMIPFPVRYHIYFGEPMIFEGEAHEEDDVVEAQVQEVKSTIQGMLDRGLEARRSIFF